MPYGSPSSLEHAPVRSHRRTSNPSAATSGARAFVLLRVSTSRLRLWTTTMARSNAALTCWLDTNAVVYLLHGHSLQESAVREAIGGRNVFVPVFVRMEYLRGVILNLAEL